MAARVLREASLCDKSKQNTLLQSIYQQKQNNRFCDVLMKVCNKDIYAHSNVLAAASPYFDGFLGQELPRQFSQRSPQIIEIQVDGSEPNQLYEDAVRIVIDFLYTGTITIKNENVSQIYEISKIMQLGNVVSFCEDFLQGKAEHGTLYTLPLNGKVHTTAVNTDVTAVNAPTELLNTWSKASKDRGLTRCKKLVSVSVQTTPIIRQLIATKSQIQASGKRYIFSNIVKNDKRKRPFEEADNILAKVLHENSETEQSGNALLQLPYKKIKVEDNSISENEPPKIVTRSGRVVIPKKWNRVEGKSESGVLRKLVKVEAKDAVEIMSDSENNEVSSKTQEQQNKVTDLTGDVDHNEDLAKEIVPEETQKTGTNTSTESSETDEVQDIASYQEDCDDASSDSQKTNIEGSDDNFEADGQDYEDDIEDVIIKKRGRPKKVIIRTDMIKQELGFERSSKEYSCSECSFVTSRVREMSAHTMCHKREQGVCFYCDRSFTDKKELAKHSQSHKGATPFECLECGVHFKTRTMLNLHLPKHSDVKPFICELCCMAFKWKHALKNHMVVHSNKREHLCDICGYSTAHKAQLRSHNLIHTGDTYKCTYPGCNFETTKKQNLKYHGVTHTRERPHQCEICGQNFSLLKNMKRHIKLHYSDRQHRCTSCDFTSTRYDKLKEHLLKQHGSGTPPERRVKVAEMMTREYSLEVPTDGSQYLPGQTLVISPLDETTETGQVSSASKKASGEAFTILTHLLEGERQAEVSLGGQGDGMQYVEQGQLGTKSDQKNDHASTTDQVVMNAGQLSTASEQEITADPVTAADLDHLQALEEVNSILVTEDGSQVILNAPSFTLQELANVLRQNEESTKLVSMETPQVTTSSLSLVSMETPQVTTSSISLVSMETPQVTTSSLALTTSSLSLDAAATESLCSQVPLHLVKQEDPKSVQYLEVLVDTAAMEGIQLQQ